jgi:phosphate-selective porin OprO/OprP
MRTGGLRAVLLSFGGVCAASSSLAALCASAEEVSAHVVAEDPDAENPTLDQAIDASEADDAEPARARTPWNQLTTDPVTMRFGAGFLFDYANYHQNDTSKAQMELMSTDALRDLRFLIKGRLNFFPRVSFTLGYMFDGATQQWRFRQTGIMLDMPELSAHLFVGRAKEGISTNKIMVGYNGWTQERATSNDAFLPILGDGVKWTGALFENKMVYNVGVFFDALSETESFNKNDTQFVSRAVYLPFAGSGSNRLLHLGAAVRYGQSDDGMLQYRSKPESFPAQSYAVTTGQFPASHAWTYEVEAYYRPGPLMCGTEYFFNQNISAEAKDPFFHGGEIFVAWLPTGEIRPYNEASAFFEGIVPNRPLFDNGPGAWELVLRLSYIDLDSGGISGGRFARITPMINWHLSANVRIEFTTGYGLLDKGGQVGETLFFATRLQLQVL